MTATEWLNRGLVLLRETPAMVVAHSFGANTLLQRLAEEPISGLNGAVLVSPFYVATDQEMNWPWFHTFLGYMRPFMAHALTVRQGADRSDPALLELMIDKVAEHLGPAGWIQWFLSVARSPGLPLHRVNLPVLLTGGTEDFTVPEPTLRALEARLPSGQVDLLPGCGHFAMLEKPAELAALIGRMLSCCVPGPESVGTAI
jgi:pimeloyl-ACP methyl ester carboxylesterase